MKVICDRSALVDSLSLVGGVTVTRSPRPVLACVKLTASEDALEVGATDLETSLRLSSPQVEVETPGEALVPAEKLNQIVRESVDPTITLEVAEQTLHIRGQDARFKVFGHPAGDFPALPGFDGQADFEIEGGELKKLIHETAFAAARENSRYAINGVLFECEPGRLNVVATDGHRLALARGRCETNQDEGPRAIVPSKALNLLLKLLGDEQQAVRVKVADNQMIFATEAGVLASNLVEGNFPAYADLIPQDNEKKAGVATDVFASAVRRAGLLTSESSRGVRMSFSPEGVKLSSRSSDVGEAEIETQIASYEGDPIEIKFNPQILLDALRVIETDEATLELKASNKPALLRAGPDYLYVVMPMNLEDE